MLINAGLVARVLCKCSSVILPNRAEHDEADTHPHVFEKQELRRKEGERSSRPNNNMTMMTE